MRVHFIRGRERVDRAFSNCWIAENWEIGTAIARLWARLRGKKNPFGIVHRAREPPRTTARVQCFRTFINNIQYASIARSRVRARASALCLRGRAVLPFYGVARVDRELTTLLFLDEYEHLRAVNYAPHVKKKRNRRRIPHEEQ